MDGTKPIIRTARFPSRARSTAFGMILLILSSEHGIAWRDQAGSVKVVVALLNCDAADGSAYKHRKKERVMRLTFVRSGGFAGKATDVEGTVTFTPAGAEVTANGGN